MNIRTSILVPFLAAVLLFAGLRPAAAFTAGDLDGDGVVTVKDAVIALWGAIDQTTLTPAQQIQADIDGDGSLDVKDVTLILETAIGLIPPLTVTSPDALTANVGDPSIQFTVQASGGAGAPQMSLTNAPPTALFTPSTGVFFWGPVMGQAGDYSLYLTVRSGVVAVERTIVLHLLPGNLPQTPPNRLVDDKIDFDSVTLPCTDGPLGVMTMSPQGDIYLVCGGSDTDGLGVIYKTTDEGVSWSALPSLPKPYINALCVNAVGDLVAAYGTVTPTTPNAVPAVAVFHQGAWIPAANITASITIASLALAPNGKDLLAVTGWQGDVWRSSDNGATFTKVISNVYKTIGDSYGGALETISSAGTKVYTGGEGNVLESDDAGNTFKDLGPANAGGNVTCIAADRIGEPVSCNRRIAGSGSPLLKFSGGVWEQVNGLDPYVIVRCLISHSQFGDVMYASNISGVNGKLDAAEELFVSYDGGSGWTRLSTNIGKYVAPTSGSFIRDLTITRSGRLMVVVSSNPSTVIISQAPVP